MRRGRLLVTHHLHRRRALGALGTTTLGTTALGITARMHETNSNNILASHASANKLVLPHTHQQSPPLTRPLADLHFSSPCRILIFTKTRLLDPVAYS